MKQGRKNTINLLKSKISALQTELIALQNQPQKHTKTALRPQSRSPKNPDYKSPTFWTRNPITHDDKYQPKKREIPSPNRKIYTHDLKKSAFPSLKHVLSSIDHNFYQSLSTTQLTPSPDSPLEKENRPAYFGKRYEFSTFGQERRLDTSKDSKRKTFQQKRNNVILNPQKQKVTRRRIVTANSKSPDKMLTDHPDSNSRVYAFAQNVLLIPKKGQVQDKNKSSLSLCSSLGDLVPIKFDEKGEVRRKRSQKKHLNQYYRDNFRSQFEFQ